MKKIYLSFLLGILVLCSYAQTEKKALISSQTKSNPYLFNPGFTKPDETQKKAFVKSIMLNQTSLSYGIKPMRGHKLCDHPNGTCDPRNLPLSNKGKLLSVDGFEVTFEVPSDTNISKICYTPRPIVNGMLKDASCPFTVPCDNPSNRDAAASSTKYFQLVWHVMQSSSGGTSSNIDQSKIDALMTELNSDFALASKTP